MKSQVKSSPFISKLTSMPAPAFFPKWLQTQREASIESSLGKGIPNRRDEEWKYTNVLGLDKVEWKFESSPKEGITAAAVDAISQKSQIRLVFENGGLRKDLSDLDSLPDGVTVRPLSQALAEDLPHYANYWLPTLI